MPFNDCFHVRCTVSLHEDNGHVLRDSAVAEVQKRLIKAKDDIDMATAEERENQ